MEIKKHLRTLFIGFCVGFIGTLLSFFALGGLIFIPFALLAIPGRLIIQIFVQTATSAGSLFFLMAIINGIIYSVIAVVISLVKGLFKRNKKL